MAEAVQLGELQVTGSDPMHPDLGYPVLRVLWPDNFVVLMAGSLAYMDDRAYREHVEREAKRLRGQWEARHAA